MAVVAPVFQSTLPLRGATDCAEQFVKLVEISIHSPLAGSDLLGFFFHRFDAISIHTPLAGSDYQHPHPNRHTHDISIHALHEESDKPITA